MRAAEFERALRERAQRASPRVAKLQAKLVFDAGVVGVWTLSFRRGKVSVRRGRAFRPTSTLHADVGTLLSVVEGTTIGVDAFLRESLFVRGNIALLLELDDLVHPRTRDPRAPRIHRLQVDGLETFLIEAGPADAPPVVLLHGLGATSASFLTTLWDLSADHRVLALDLPGFGETDKPLVPLRPAFFARHVLGVLDALGIARAHLVGNSMGGRVALEVALQAPERVDRLGLLAPSMAWKRFRAAAFVVRLLRHELAIVPLPILHRGVLLALRSMFAEPDRMPRPAMNAAADEFLRVFATSRGRIAFFNAMREIYLEEPHGEEGFWERLPRLSRPALFVFGDRDRLVPASFSRWVSAAVPSARCVLFEGCGHVPQYEQPERTHALLRSFFAERP